jgi:hypothetical protein
LTGATVIARMVLYAEKNYLIDDNVSCQIDANGDILVPFDNAVAKIPHGVIKIEVSITRETDVLTLQFPLFVFVNDTILAAAEVLPESEGTIPELLKAVKEELERVQGYVDEEQVKDIIDGVLSGVTTNVPTLLIDNTVNQQYNPEGHLIWYYIDSDGARHNLFDFTPYLGGTDDYNALKNKPSVNGVELRGNKTLSDLKIQPEIFAQTEYFNLTNTLDGKQFLSLNTRELNVQSNLSNATTIQTSYDIVTYEQRALTLFERGEIPVPEFGVYQKFMNEFRDGYQAFYFSYESGKVFRRSYGSSGFSDWQEIELGSQIASGVVNQNGTISFYDADGNLLFTTTGASVIGPQGAPGNDYVLTAQDKADIADIVLQELPTTQGVLYGNASD